MKKLYFAALDWKSYQDLETSGGRSDVYDDWKEAPVNAEILAFEDLENAQNAVKAFLSLCCATWTPNQDGDDLIKNTEIIETSKSELNRLRDLANYEWQEK